LQESGPVRVVDQPTLHAAESSEWLIPLVPVAL
jgi:hypothetical protein